MHAAPLADLRPEGISEAAWWRLCGRDTIAEEVSAFACYLPDAVVHFQRDDHDYFAQAEFTQGRGVREISRGTLGKVLEDMASWQRNGLPLGPHHVPERARQWTHHKHDNSHRATTPRGEARILPFVGELSILVLVPDFGVCVLYEHDDVELLKQLAYDRPATPRVAIRLSGLRHDFVASSLPGEIAQVEVHGAKYVLVPHIDERGAACVAVDVILPNSTLPKDRPLVQRLAVHPVVDLEHRDILWSNDEERPRAAWSPPWPYSAQHTEASSTRSPASAGPKLDSAGAGAPMSRGDTKVDGALATRLATTRCGARPHGSARNPPDGVDPLAWEGFVLQAEHTATLAFDARLGRRVYVEPMRAQSSEALITTARTGKSIKGTGTALRRQLEHHAGARLQGSQSAFKEWMRVLMNHTNLGREVRRYVREIPLADLWVKDSEYCEQMRAYALAARPDPPAHPATPKDPVFDGDADDGATRRAPGEPSPRRPAPTRVHAVLLMNGDRIVASRFSVPSDESEAVIRELTATAGPYTHVTLDGRRVGLVDVPEPIAAPTEGGRGHERPDEQVEDAALSAPGDAAPSSDTSKTNTVAATSEVDPSTPSTSGPTAAAPSSHQQRPRHVGSPIHRPGQHSQPDVPGSPGEGEPVPGFRSRDGPPNRRFREADLTEDLSKDPWIPK